MLTFYQFYNIFFFLDIIFVDWADLADGNYLLDAVPNAVKLSNILADAVLELINNGIDGNKLHIVGHSLGKLRIYEK